MNMGLCHPVIAGWYKKSDLEHNKILFYVIFRSFKGDPMYRKIIPFVLVLLLAACSILPLPQAAAISPTNPHPSITNTPQPTYTPEPTLTSTPIPETFVIQDDA